ncbi:MAG: hypothetical protein WBP81_13015 [Solirubrobacteraceae bacterium]
MDPLPITGNLGEFVDCILRHLEPIARAKLLALEGGQLIDLHHGQHLLRSFPRLVS